MDPLNGYEGLISYDRAKSQWVEVTRRAKYQFWQRLSGYEFEDELAKLYKAHNYQVLQTKRTGDEGVDIWLKRDGLTYVVECKHHNKPVGVGAARSILGAMFQHKADGAILASVSGFTSGVQRIAISQPLLQLLNLDQITDMQMQLVLKLSNHAKTCTHNDPSLVAD